MPVVQKAKDIVSKSVSLKKGKENRIDPDSVSKAIDYVDKYWENLKKFHPKDDESLVGLPNPYLVPSFSEQTGFDYNELYYWDSYFMVQGMLDDEHKDLVIGILDNLIFLFNRFKVIPNASRTYLTGRSQPPLLTSFIFDIYDTYRMSNDWLESKIKIAEEEYFTVWLGTKKPNERKVYKDLSRYYDINYLHDLAEAESGWDMTPRFERKALNYLPVDLNCLLYKYEVDFSRAAEILGDHGASVEWSEKAKNRKENVDKLMWDKVRSFYFDYNYVKQKRSSTYSLAAYFALWSGLADDSQAESLVKSLKRFEHKGGLTTTDTVGLGQFVMGGTPTQWAYPNGWAPLHFITVKGLEKYGYHAPAKRIALKWINTNLNWFIKNDVFLEKYNVVYPEKPPMKGLYPSQVGFGWTNAVFERFVKDYLA